MGGDIILRDCGKDFWRRVFLNLSTGVYPRPKLFRLAAQLFKNSEPVWMLFAKFQHVGSQANSDWHFATERGGTACFLFIAQNTLTACIVFSSGMSIKKQRGVLPPRLLVHLGRTIQKSDPDCDFFS
jgi:hypothetical protein